MSWPHSSISLYKNYKKGGWGAWPSPPLKNTNLLSFLCRNFKLRWCCTLSCNFLSIGNLTPPINIEWNRFPANRSMYMLKYRDVQQSCFDTRYPLLTAPHTLSFDFSASHLQCFLSYVLIYASLLIAAVPSTPPPSANKTVFLPLSLWSFCFQTGIKACEFLYNNCVALFKCSLSLLDVEVPVISCYLRTQNTSMFLFLGV